MTPGNMEGKICLITGATSGIGLEAARVLARQGASLALVGRDRGRGEAALAELRRTCPDAKLQLLLADFTSLASVRALAQAVTSRYSRLDVLLNNAGLILDERQVTQDGLEATLAINHLAPFLLTHQLLDLLKASGAARVVNVSSDAHRLAALDLDDLQAERRYRGFTVYANSKLANILFTRALARRLEGTRVTANCLHPGVVRTGFGHNTTGPVNLAVKLFGVFMLSAEKGARTSVYLASSPEVEGVSGKYFFRCREVRPSRAARDEALAERLWQMSVELTGVSG